MSQVPPGHPFYPWGFDPTKIKGYRSHNVTDEDIMILAVELDEMEYLDHVPNPSAPLGDPEKQSWGLIAKFRRLDDRKPTEKREKINKAIASQQRIVTFLENDEKNDSFKNNLDINNNKTEKNSARKTSVKISNYPIEKLVDYFVKLTNGSKEKIQQLLKENMKQYEKLHIREVVAEIRKEFISDFSPSDPIEFSFIPLGCTDFRAKEDKGAGIFLYGMNINEGTLVKIQHYGSNEIFEPFHRYKILATQWTGVGNEGTYSFKEIIESEDETIISDDLMPFIPDSFDFTVFMPYILIGNIEYVDYASIWVPNNNYDPTDIESKKGDYVKADKIKVEDGYAFDVTVKHPTFGRFRVRYFPSLLGFTTLSALDTIKKKLNAEPTLERLRAFIARQDWMFIIQINSKSEYTDQQNNPQVTYNCSGVAFLAPDPFQLQLELEKFKPTDFTELNEELDFLEDM